MFLQPLDVSVNKLFKLAFKKQYLKKQKLETICENKFNINKENIIKMVFDIWNNENNQKKFIDSFLFYGIS